LENWSKYWEMEGENRITALEMKFTKPTINAEISLGRLLDE
jgi:hypothetical protein